MNFVIAALRSGNVSKAQMLLQDRLMQDPRDAQALAKLSEIALDQGRIEDATVLLRRATTADPSPERRVAFIRHQQRFANPANVLTEIEDLPADVRSTLEVMSIEATTLGVLGLQEQQIALYEKMVKLQRSRPGIRISLANALKTIGRTEEAVSTLRRAIKITPTCGNAYWTLANFKSFRFTPAEITQMRNALRKVTSEDDAVHLHFALGKAFEDRKDYEASFRHYRAGNAIRAANLDRDHVTATSYVDRGIEVADERFFQKNRGCGHAERGPIFVVGMNRAGSTLVEQILASHPLVEGTAELVVMPQLRERMIRIASGEGGSGSNAWDAIQQLGPGEFAKIGSEYLERTRAFRQTDRPYFVDKLPANWLNVVLIRLALPNAIIIDARRHPLACGFSNFKQLYANGISWSYDLSTIGAYYRNYCRMMEHLDRVQPGCVHRVINERMVDDPEREIRALLDFAGLPFDAACLAFQDTKRAIRTPSAEQVRKGINADGVAYWRNYERWLDPLKEALGPSLRDWDR